MNATATSRHPLADAVERGLRPVIFHFDTERGFVGVTDDTEWNGFLNVRVSPETLAEIEQHFADEGLLDQPDDFHVPVGDDGLVDLSGGFATIEAEYASETENEAENRLALEVGHPDGCSYTLKATVGAVLAHLIERSRCAPDDDEDGPFYGFASPISDADAAVRDAYVPFGGR